MPINPATGLGYNNKSGYRKGTTEFTRNAKLQRRYGITLREFEEMHAAQGFKCAVCGGAEHNDINWHVDHAHDSKVIRGILCGHCNRGIGLFRDRPDLLRTAAFYIEGKV